MKLKIDDVRTRFIKHLGGEPGSVYASPGRINLIGEHTDYNGGFVFPGAVEQGMIAEIRPNGTRTIRAYSIDLKDYAEFSLDERTSVQPLPLHLGGGSRNDGTRSNRTRIRHSLRWRCA